MAFIKVKSITGGEVQFERLQPADGVAMAEGQMLAYTGDGKVRLANPTEIPAYVAISSVPALTPQTNLVTCIRVEGTDEYEVRTTLTVPATAIGTYRTLSADASNITATATAGVFLITSTDGATNSSIVRGYFRR